MLSSAFRNTLFTYYSKCFRRLLSIFGGVCWVFIYTTMYPYLRSPPWVVEVILLFPFFSSHPIIRLQCNCVIQGRLISYVNWCTCFPFTNYLPVPLSSPRSSSSLLPDHHQLSCLTRNYLQSHLIWSSRMMYLTLSSHPQIKSIAITFILVSKHKDIPGNGTIDQAVKQADLLPPLPLSYHIYLSPSSTEFFHFIRLSIRHLWKVQWKVTASHNSSLNELRKNTASWEYLTTAPVNKKSSSTGCESATPTPHLSSLWSRSPFFRWEPFLLLRIHRIPLLKVSFTKNLNINSKLGD